jgi:hypothetical protein
MLATERFATSLAYESHEVQAVEVYKAMWQAALSVAQEPVESQFYDESTGKWCNFINEQHRQNTIKDGYKVRDLYTHPHPKCEPLDDGMVLQMCRNSTTTNHEGIEICNPYKFADMIEKAHGIGVV